MPSVIANTYEIIAEIGVGGGGTVFLAYHKRLGKRVVLKEDKRKVTTDEELLRREVDVLKNLHHTYIPQVYDYFIENNKVYTVMDFVEGESLDRALKRGETFSQAQIVKWGSQVLSALDYLHAPVHGNPPKGYVHSDIKPANIMLQPSGDICLIDFNIALAIGEENIVGRSAGYASPEHYGLDYSNIGVGNTHSKSSNKKIKPDIRSDIYMLGATLYHLLTGERPAQNALEVKPLSEQNYNPSIIAILSKAMHPNPDLRYQTAEEMLVAFRRLREDDPRVIKLRRAHRIMSFVLVVCFLMSISVSGIGLKRMQTTEEWLKLAEYSTSSLQEGNQKKAVLQALDAFPLGRSVLRPSYLPEPQVSLTNALGVYDLAPGYKSFSVITLPSAPLYLKLCSTGQFGACMYSGALAVINTSTGSIVKTFSAMPSALAEVEFVGEDVIIFSGADGLTSYSLSTNKLLWSAAKATGISLSTDKKHVAAILDGQDYARIYNVSTGEQEQQISFSGRTQKTGLNNVFANANDHLFALNEDGSWLALSFADGSVSLFSTKGDGDRIDLMDGNSGYNHFEGGFYNQYFAFSATNSQHTQFAVINIDQREQTGGFDAEGYFHTEADSRGIYIGYNNVLVNIDPISGKQQPLINSNINIIDFSSDQGHTVVNSVGGVEFYNEDAQLMNRLPEEKYDFICLKNGVSLLGNRTSPKVRIMRYNDNANSIGFRYDATYDHEETRVGPAGDTVMMFSINGFRVVKKNGDLIKEENFLHPNDIYDQQFIRSSAGAVLEVTYNNGTVSRYDGETGTYLGDTLVESSSLDPSLKEEFETEKYLFDSPLHGATVVYDKNTGEQICTLNNDAYLTYVVQQGDNYVLQYMSTDGTANSLLTDSSFNTIAELPYLCDVYNGQLFFDYETGVIASSPLYDLETLLNMARKDYGSEKG